MGRKGMGQDDRDLGEYLTLPEAGKGRLKGTS